MMRPSPFLSSFAERVAARVSGADVAAFQRDGAVWIGGLLNTDELALLASGIETNLAAPSPRAKIASRPDDPGFFIEDFCNWQQIDAYRRFIVDSPLALLAQRLMGSQTVRLYHDHLLVKEPGTRQRTPWHQDQPYYNIDGAQTVSMWIPVDPVPRAATLDFVCFHMLALHAAAGIDGTNRRRVFSVRFLGDDVRHAPRAWVTSPAFPGLADELPAGAEMDHPLFPKLIG